MSWRKGSADKKRCQFIRDDGSQCAAYALRSTHELEDEDGCRCRVHSLSPAELAAQARRMSMASAAARAGDVEAAPRLSGLDPGVTLAALLPIVREALEAKYEFTHEVNHNVRLAAVGTLLASFPREYRRTPEDMCELIRRAIPAEIRSPEMEDAQKVCLAMRKAWLEVDGFRWSNLVGLWVAPFPEWTCAPFENRRKIQGSRPKPIPPGEAPVVHLGEDVALEREGKLPLLLERAEPEDEPLAEASLEDESYPVMESTDVNPW